MVEHQILIVANRTLGGEHLVEAAKARVSAGADAIWIVVPAAARENTAPRSGPAWAGKAHWSDFDQPAPSDAYQLAEMRLERALDRFRAFGVAVGGEVGDQDPLRAIGAALAGHPCEEVLISTLPRAASNWLRVDVPRRVQRKFHIPVTTVPAASGQQA